MPNLPNNNSFIPKQGPEKRARKTASKQVHLFTIFSYILFFSTLIASGAVVFYGRYMDDQLEAAVSELNQKIDGFDTEKMAEVREFDSKIKQAQNRVDGGVSVAAIFNALEASTAQTVKLTDLQLVRNLDTDYMLTAGIETDSFDSSIFQRSTFMGNNVVSDLEIEELQIGSEIEGEGSESISEKTVRFTAKINVPISTIPFTPSTNVPTFVPDAVPPQAEAVNTTNISDI